MLDQWEVSNLLSFSSLLGKSCRDAHYGSIWVQLEPQTVFRHFLVRISSVHSRGAGSLGEPQALHPELLRSCAQPEQSNSSAGELPLFNDCHHTGHWEHPLRNCAVFILLCFCQTLFPGFIQYIMVSSAEQKALWIIAVLFCRSSKPALTR